MKEMEQMNTKVLQDRQQMNMLAARIPGVIFLVVIFTATIIFQFLFDHWSLVMLSLFSFQMVVLGIHQWYAYKLVQYNVWIYFLVQSLFTFASSFLLYGAYDRYNVVIFTVYAYYVCQAIGLVATKRRYLITFLVSLYALNIVVIVPRDQLADFFIIGLPIMLMCISYAVMFFSQLYERVNAQVTLEKLEIAHEQLEELTLKTERQRMARDLHDNLAQGLVGVTMQLDAANRYLERADQGKAVEIISQVRGNAKRLLADARLSIDNLRAADVEAKSFKKKLEESVEYFTSTTDMIFHLEFAIDSSMSEATEDQCYHMIREGMMNAIKHSHAKSIMIRLSMDETSYQLSVHDDGKGFNSTRKASKKGSYGLIGLKERATLIGATVSIHSKKGQGTEIMIHVPRLRSEEDA